MLIHCFYCFHCLWEFCVWSLFCYTVLSLLSSFTIILTGKRESWLLYLNYHSHTMETNHDIVRKSHMSLTVIKQDTRKTINVRKRTKIRNQYNQVPHLTTDTNEKVTNSQLDITNDSQEVTPFQAGDHKAPINRRAQKHNKHKTEVLPWNGQ